MNYRHSALFIMMIHGLTCGMLAEEPRTAGERRGTMYASHSIRGDEISINGLPLLTFDNKVIDLMISYACRRQN